MKACAERLYNLVFGLPFAQLVLQKNEIFQILQVMVVELLALGVQPPEAPAAASAKEDPLFFTHPEITVLLPTTSKA